MAIRDYPDYTKAINIFLQTLETLKMEIDAQTVGVKIESEWQIYKGNMKLVNGWISGLGVDETFTIPYTVPAGKRLYIFNIHYASTKEASGAAIQPGFFYLQIDGAIFFRNNTSVDNPGVSILLGAPIRIDAGQTIKIVVKNVGSAAGTFEATWHGYEVAEA